MVYGRQTRFQLGVRVQDITTTSQGDMGVHVIPICQKFYNVLELEASVIAELAD